MVEHRLYTAMVGSSTLSAPTIQKKVEEFWKKKLLDRLEKFCIIRFSADAKALKTEW